MAGRMPHLGRCQAPPFAQTMAFTCRSLLQGCLSAWRLLGWRRHPVRARVLTKYLLCLLQQKKVRSLRRLKRSKAKSKKPLTISQQPLAVLLMATPRNLQTHRESHPKNNYHNLRLRRTTQAKRRREKRCSQRSSTCLVST